MSTVVSGDGFEVRLPGRSGLEYVIGGRQMRMDAEMLGGDVDIVIYRSSIGLWSDGHIASEEERQAILDNVRSALLRAGIKTRIE